ncbi:MAG TPA: coagulation factor 5/8 type domain-containing protein, partial [Desulfobacterales bacterium]|nr:coagulation factor 5/8 type domain-containing protein [Desulfobacterales bacterium]
KLRQEARKILSDPPCRYRPQGREGVILEASRTVLRRVYLLAFFQRLEGGDRFAHRLWLELDAAARFPDWRPGHFLDTAEMTHAFAIAYDWLYDIWSPEQRAVLAQAIRDKGLKPGLAAYQGAKNSGWWVKSAYNWNQVCNGGLGLGALAVFETCPDLAAQVLQGALRSLPRALAQFAPDGGSYEGPLYWGYATFYHTLFLAALETALGCGFGLAASPGFEATGYFPIYVTGPRDRTFNYADADDLIYWTAQMFWLARRFQQPVFAGYARRITKIHPLDLLWFETLSLSPREAGLPLDRYFRGVEVATFRSSWDDPLAIFAGFKAGDNRAGHSHLDLGSFILEAQGVRWALDLGGDDYNLPGYFGRNRWDYYRLRTEGHNTLVINPGPDPGQDPEASAVIFRFRSGPDASLAIADLTPTYFRQAQRVWRGLALVNRRRVLIQDEILAEKPLEVLWALHTEAEVHLSADNRTATLSRGGARLVARILAPPEAVFRRLSARPGPLSPHPVGQAENQGVSKLAIHVKEVVDLRLAVELTPLTGDMGPESLERKITPLAQW